jgi:squalene-hopene/tetraprenyl-beta-curcumene cyclase
MAQAVPSQDVITPDDLKRIAGHLVRHQEESGAWSWAEAPPKNRAPPFFESDDLATTLADLALRAQLPADPKAKSEIRDAREKGVAWLAKSKPEETTQLLTIRLFHDLRAGRPAEEIRAEAGRLLALQRKDGGWAQTKDRDSDAFATGQVLYFLNIAGVKREDEPIKRGVAFLLSTQREDGSWPMTPRGHPGEKGSTLIWPITHLGSCWATMGLIRSVPH